MKLLKKAQAGGMQSFILAIVTVAVVLGVGLIVLGELAATQQGTATGGKAAVAYCNTTTSEGCGAAFNSTNTIITKLATVPTWIGIIIIVALAFIVLSFFIGKNQ